MTADKRTVHTDALATLGTIIDDKQKRDAIHLAVIPAIAAIALAPGEHVYLLGGHAHKRVLDWEADSRLRPIGIVDPFLADNVQDGEWFWLVIYPRVITSLRHVWTHPVIKDELPLEKSPDDVEKSEQWLRRFCERNNDAPYYEDLLNAVRGVGDASNDGLYLTVYGSDAHGDIPPELWDHVEIVTGLRNLPRAQHFSCSC